MRIHENQIDDTYDCVDSWESSRGRIRFVWIHGNQVEDTLGCVDSWESEDTKAKDGRANENKIK